MRTSILAAWIVGEGIIVYRCVKGQKRPPMPGELLASSALFVMLALLSDPQPQVAGLLAWGLDIAAFLNLAPMIGGPKIPQPAVGQTLTIPNTGNGANLQDSTITNTGNGNWVIGSSSNW